MSNTKPRGTGSAVLIGVLVGVLLFVVGGGGFLALRQLGDDDTPAGGGHTSSTSPDPTPSKSSKPRGPMPKTDPALAAYYGQKLDWKDCGGNDCAVMKVPLDYSQPGGKTVGIAVLKVPAKDQAHKVGALVVNPGGPGGSGVDYASQGSLAFGKTLPSKFDIVGFDPRGVGQSDPIECIDTAETDTLLGTDPDPDTKAERVQMDALIHGFGEGCLTHSGDLARHISTVEAAKDMDILRGVLAEPKLTYFGASYGTFLGATYANLFPTHVGRFVLDGAIDPSLSNEEMTLAQAHGFEVALRAYVKDCVDRGGCFLGDTVDAGTKRIRALLDQIEASPLKTDTDRELTAGWAMIGVWMPLYVKQYWPQLTTGLKQAMGGDGSKLLSLADLYSSRGSDSYYDNSMEALYDVNCLDAGKDVVATKDVPKYFPEFLKASPTFGKAFAFGLSTCSVWPIKSTATDAPLHAKGAPPIVVVGTTRDPATPLAWAQGLAKELDSGVLVTRDGDGHTGYNQGNDCVNGAVNDYLIEAKVPKDGLMC